MGNKAQTHSDCSDSDDTFYKHQRILFKPRRNIDPKKLTLEGIKELAVTVLSSNSELSVEVCEIIAEYMDFEPWPSGIVESFTIRDEKFQEAMDQFYNYLYAEWVITENNRKDKPCFRKENVIAIYGYGHSWGRDVDYWIAGKARDVENGATETFYFFLEAHEWDTIGGPMGVDAQKLTVSSTWNDMYLYGLSNDEMRTFCHSLHQFVEATEDETNAEE